jgi:hypothetical protein
MAGGAGCSLRPWNSVCDIIQKNIIGHGMSTVREAQIHDFGYSKEERLQHGE